MAEKDIPLPLLRPDLVFYPGPAQPDGSPTFSVYDPLARTYDKLSWDAAEILQRLRAPKGLEDLKAELARETTLRVGDQEILEFCKDAQLKGLTLSSLFKPVEELLEEKRKQKVQLFNWLIHNYLYFRLPLVRPDAFLGRTLRYVRLLGSRPALFAYAFLLGFGVLKVLQNPEEFLGTFPSFFNLAGAFWFGVAVTLIKAAHEFAHAYVAKRLGCRVPVMGVAFMVLWPVAYSDVTDAWKLSSRADRLKISVAGVVAELGIAGLALFAWMLAAPHSMLQQIAFVVSSSSVLSTLLVNVNPAMRYDGYYILMDLLGVDNLQSRAFAMTRWFYRRFFFGIDVPPPEADFSTGQLAGMIFYSMYAWLYRIILYVGIAVLVYYKFTKVLGIFLFLIEVWYFISRPFYMEAKALYAIKEQFKWNMRLAVTCSLLLAVLLWFVLPLSRHFSAPAVTVPEHSQTIYVPASGMIRDLAVKRDGMVFPGQKLLQVDSNELKEKIAVAELEREAVQKKMELSSYREDSKDQLPQLEEELLSLTAQINGLSNQMQQCDLRAEVAGRVYVFDDTLANGRFVSQNEVLGKIADFSRIMVYAFINEGRIEDLRIGDPVTFIDQADPWPRSGTVQAISPVRSETIEYAGLTSVAKGLLPVVREKGKLVMLESNYFVEIKLDDGQYGEARARFGQTGEVWFHSRPRSLFMDMLRHVYRVLVRESGF